MWKWLKKKLGILSLATRVEYLEKDIIRINKNQSTLANKTRIGRAMRYDEKQRVQKRRRKGVFV
jgi:hypothetical protein